jgi:hypothetical protein
MLLVLPDLVVNLEEVSAVIPMMAVIPSSRFPASHNYDPYNQPKTECIGATFLMRTGGQHTTEILFDDVCRKISQLCLTNTDS